MREYSCRRIESLARELGIRRVWAVGNALGERSAKSDRIESWNPAVIIPWSEELRAQAREGRPVEAVESDVSRAMSDLRTMLEANVVDQA